MEKGLDPEISWIGSYVLDEQGDPQPEQDILVWAYWYASAEHQVALSEFAWGRVSTVFLGRDMYAPFPKDLDSTHRPRLWETMVFLRYEKDVFTDIVTRNPRLQEWHLAQRRYQSRSDALEGHREMVENCLADVDDAEDRIPILSA